MKSFLPNLFTDPNAMRDPFATLRRQIDDLATSFGREWPLSTHIGAAAPALNVSETDKAIQIAAELPGVDERDIKVEVEGQRIVISGEKKREHEEKEKNWHVVERSYGSFRRAVTLPFEPAGEAVSAHFDKGVLHIEVAKPAAAKSASKTIEIKTGLSEEKKTSSADKAA
jgi:HSP20 family protein